MHIYTYIYIYIYIYITGKSPYNISRFPLLLPRTQGGQQRKPRARTRATRLFALQRQIWHIKDSQGQIPVGAFRSMQCLKVFFARQRYLGRKARSKKTPRARTELGTYKKLARFWRGTVITLFQGVQTSYLGRRAGSEKSRARERERPVYPDNAAWAFRQQSSKQNRLFPLRTSDAGRAAKKAARKNASAPSTPIMRLGLSGKSPKNILGCSLFVPRMRGAPRKQPRARMRAPGIPR